MTGCDWLALFLTVIISNVFVSSFILLCVLVHRILEPLHKVAFIGCSDQLTLTHRGDTNCVTFFFQLKMLDDIFQLLHPLLSVLLSFTSV